MENFAASRPWLHWELRLVEVALLAGAWESKFLSKSIGLSILLILVVLNALGLLDDVRVITLVGNVARRN